MIERASMSDRNSWWASPRLWLMVVVLLAAALRMVNLDWDQNRHFHPDERAVTMAVTRLSFSPLQLDPDFFAYGSLPIYMAKATSSLVTWVDPWASTYDGIIYYGRALSAVIGTLTVLLTMLLGARLYDLRTGVLGGFLLATTVLHLQNSRFLTVDVTLTFFVLLALLQLVKLSHDGRRSSFIWAGVCVGLAVATKFSAMALLAPLGIAILHRWWMERRLLPIIGWSVASVLAGVVAFAVAEPYIVLNFDRVMRDITEQSHMVRNAGLFPFTTQYVGTPKYAYEIEQLVLWGMAPPLGLAALWATLTRPAQVWRGGRADDLVLLFWVVPFFLVTGWFEVKFPRYLLPIYPVLALWAAEWLMRKYRAGSFGRVVLPLVVVGTALAALSFTSLYTRPHTVVAASEWFFKHVPPGSKVLTQDWDEGFPMPLPGYSAGNYDIVPFGYYERPDTTAKMKRLAGELASADFIAFQTKRLYGALTRAPDRFPLSNNYFYRLFAGDLGYTLIHEVASRPSLFGYEVPTELGDESLSVYDHPKVIIFRNDGRLGEDELYDRIVNGLPSKQLSRNDLLLAAPAEKGTWEATGASPAVRSGVVAFALFAVLVQVLGLGAYLVLRRFLAGSGVYALAKVVGVLAFAYGSWLVISLGAADFTQGTLAVVAGAVVLLGVALRATPTAGLPPRSEIVATEGIFWFAFVLLVGVRAFNPEIYWGEKPMDFSILNALMRTTTLPPPEPWFAGSPLYYSYFGYYVAASLGKLLHVHPALTYNLAVALVGGLAGSAVFAAGAAISGSWRTGLLAAFFAVLIGNLAGPGEALSRNGLIDFHYYWATSRVIEHTINEYPLWSFLFADLHAHMMVMPFTMTFVALAAMWVRATVYRDETAQRSGGRLVLLLLLGLSLGTIIVTNAWSTPTYVLFFPFVLGLVWLVEGSHRGFFGFLGGALGRVLVPAALVAGLAWVFYQPFWANFAPPERNFGWEPTHRVAAGDFFEIFGLYLFVLIPFLLAVWVRAVRIGTLGRGLLLLAALGVLGAALAVSTRSFLTALFVLALANLLSPGLERRWRIPVAMAAFAFAVTAGTDVVYVWDRMNTIFKFYLESWFLLAIAAAVATSAVWQHGLGLGPLRRLWQAGLVLLVGVGLFTATTAIWAVIHTDRVPTPEPTLDGMAYLESRSPHELAAFNWLNDNVKGIPVLLEAHGDSYQEFTRVSMNTGLPTVLGWGYHVFQRAQPWSDINRRKADIEAAYTSSNLDVVAAILERYRVALVFVGSLERRTYAGGNLERFREWDSLLTPIYENDAVTVFAVNGQFRGTMPVTTIEQIERVEGEEAGRPQDAPGRLHQPRGLAVAPNGNLIVADFGNHRIQELKPDGDFVRKWGSLGELPGQFKEPCAVAVGADGSSYVADTWNHRVQKFSPTGEYQLEWSASFYGPRGVAVAPTGDVFVADTGNNRIVRFTPDGKELRRWGGQGSNTGEFLEPMGLAVDANGRVYVCDNGNGRMQMFTVDGQPLGAFPVPGWESKVFSEPDVTVDVQGRIWVTVPGEKQIRAYDERGTLLATVTSQSQPNVFFATPMGIDVDAARGELVVADLDGRFVRIPLPAAAAAEVPHAEP
jgi:YYY domain-containing protein